MSRRTALTASLCLAMAVSFGVATSSFAGPAAAPPPKDQTPPAEGTDRGSTVNVAVEQKRLEASMTELGQLAEDAKKAGDAVRSACVQTRREVGSAVMEVATGELLVLRDASATAQQKSFAKEKLQAAANRLEAVVEQARQCMGDQAPEDEDDLTDNDADQPDTVPIPDPTQPGGSSPVPPAVNDSTPPTVSSPSA